MRLDHLLSGKIALKSERPLLSAVVEHTACEREPAGADQGRQRAPINGRRSTGADQRGPDQAKQPATGGHFAEQGEGSVAQLVRAPS